MNNYLKTGLVILVIASILPSFIGLGAEDKPVVKGIAYVAYNFSTKTGDIWLMDEDGFNKRNLTNHKADDTLPVWSPDGKQIAFISDRDSKDKTYNLYVMDADGSNQHRLSPIRVAYDWIAWSPDAKKIAFAGQSDDKDTNWNWEIYVIDTDGMNHKRLTDNSSDDVTPKWSPDGKKIAFINDTRSPKKKRETIEPGLVKKIICLIDPDGTNLISLVDFKTATHRLKQDYPLCHNYQIVNWTPDSKKIVSSFTRDTHCEECNDLCMAIWIVDIESKKVKSLTNNKYCEDYPHLSPDGKNILFSAFNIFLLERGCDSFVMGFDGQNQKKVSRINPINTGPGASWSPDSKKLVMDSLNFYIGDKFEYHGIMDKFSSILYIFDTEWQFFTPKPLMPQDPNTAYIMPAWSPVK